MFWGQNIIKHMKCSPWRKNKETALRDRANMIGTLFFIFYFFYDRHFNPRPARPK